MAKQRVTVNGVEYDSVEQSRNEVVLSSSKHTGVFVTSLDELQTQYGVKTAYFVRLALDDRARREANRV